MATSSASSRNRGQFDDYDQFMGSSARAQMGKSQLDMYFDKAPLDYNSELDVLEFWNQTSVGVSCSCKASSRLTDHSREYRGF